MNNQDLKKIYLIRETLKDSGYFDIERISNEIYQYSNEKHIPLEDIFSQIKLNKPWEYIKGEVEFHGDIFKINQNTLIPRIETEDLVDITKEEIKRYSPSLVIDLGTGSGCILLSLAKDFKDTDMKFLGIDISRKTLKVAKRNSRYLKSRNISFKKSNLLKNINTKDTYCIVANLPYIPTEKYLKLDISVREYEPRMALDGGEDGLKLYEDLFKQISQKENKPVFLAIEFETSTKNSLENIIKRYFKNLEYTFKKDFREKERFLIIYF